MIDEKRVEELLREYAKHLPEERLFSEEIARQLQEQLRPSDPPARLESSPEHR